MTPGLEGCSKVEEGEEVVVEMLHTGTVSMVGDAWGSRVPGWDTKRPPVPELRLMVAACWGASRECGVLGRWVVVSSRGTSCGSPTMCRVMGSSSARVTCSPTWSSMVSVSSVMISSSRRGCCSSVWNMWSPSRCRMASQMVSRDFWQAALVELTIYTLKTKTYNIH